MSEHIVSVSDDSFEEEITNTNLPTIVDFWAEWCGPCRIFGPIYEEVAADYQDRVKFIKVNVDQNPNSASKYGVQGIPTIVLFKNGSVDTRKVGALSKTQLIEFIDSNL